jgi:hypothetical protein
MAPCSKCNQIPDAHSWVLKAPHARQGEWFYLQCGVCGKTTSNRRSLWEAKAEWDRTARIEAKQQKRVSRSAQTQAIPAVDASLGAAGP